MKTSRLPLLLRTTALVVLLAAAGTWLATGRHVGWTQTSVVTMQQDEVTGIEYPVRRPGFVAGLEVPALGGAVAVLLGGLSILARNRRAQAA